MLAFNKKFNVIIDLCSWSEFYAKNSSKRREIRVKIVHRILLFEGVKLNTDGCSKGNPGASDGVGILRDKNDKVIFVFACFFENGTILEAEFKAIFYGIHLCLAQGVTSFQVEPYSLVLVQILNGVIFCLWFLHCIYEEIYKLWQHFSINFLLF